MGEQAAKAVQQKVQVGHDQVDGSTAPEIGVSVVYSAQIILKGHNVTLPDEVRDV